MKKSMKIALVPFLVLGLCSSLMAQERASSSRTGSSGSSEVHRITLGGSCEYWRADVEIDTPLGDLDGDVLHSLFMARGDYDYMGLGDLVIGGHLGLGLDNPALGAERWQSTGPLFESGFVIEFGGDVRYNIDKLDFGGGLIYRFGEMEGDSSNGPDPEYEYTLLQLAGQVGYHVTDNVRPFFEMRLNMYDGEVDMGGGLDADVEFDNQIGVSVGSDFEVYPLVGSLEIMFIDVNLGFLASVGWRL